MNKKEVNLNNGVKLLMINTNNESCIDEINLMVKVKNGIIKDSRSYVKAW